MRSLRLTFAAAIAVVAATALAAAPARAGTLGLTVAGEPAKQPVIETTLEPWLARAGHQVRLRALDAKATDKLVDCFILTDQRCAEPVVKQARLDGFLFVMVEVKRDTKAQTDEIRLTGWLFGADGGAIASQSVYCKACRNDTLGPTAEDLARTLFSVADVGTGRVKITSAPTGARVAIDGAAAGATPLEQGLRSGPHVIELDLGGHYPERREITVAKGATAEVDVPLRRIETPPPAGKRGPLPFVAMGAGAALVITGAVMIAIDQDCTAGGPCDVATTEREYRNSAPVGVGLAAAGVVAAGAGVYLYLRAPKAASTAVAAPWVTPSAAGVAVGARF